MDYDGNGARVRKYSPSGAETLYVNSLYECDQSGACTSYIFAGGTRIARKEGSAIFYIHQDHQGSTRVVTNAAGTNVEDIEYSPYGYITKDTQIGPYAEGYKFTSQLHDTETGLHYYNARYYDPYIGRFITADTIVPDPGNPQSLNRYAYVINNPVNYVDPTGHWSVPGLKELEEWTNDTWQRNEDEIVAGTVVAATVVTAVVCNAACASAMPAIYGALAGEAVGGYAAYQAGGSLSRGVIVGGVVGGVTGAAGGYAGGSVETFIGGHAGSIAGGFLEGGIIGAGSGGVAGYAGGAGNWDTIRHGVYLGAATGAILGGAIGGLQYQINSGGLKPDIISFENIKKAFSQGAKGAGSGMDALGNRVVSGLTEAAVFVGKSLALSYILPSSSISYGILSLAVGNETINQTGKKYCEEPGCKVERIEILRF